MTGTFHVLLVDDHDIVREGLKTALRGHAEFNIVGEARDGDDALKVAVETRPHLVVMDIRMPGSMDGIEACREIRSRLPDTNVLMLTSYGDEKAVLASVLAGAGGFMLKEVRMPQLLEAMRTVAAGGTTLDSQSAALILEQLRKGNIVTEEDRVASELNERELVILDLIADGLTNREIGEELYLSEKTVKHHVSDILAKLGVTRRVEAATFAVRRSSRKFDQG